jgi:hypothetical protein
VERGWRISDWSRERGRGTITSDAGTREFDASVALVDDFVADELVDIVLEHGEVRRIQPRSARSPIASIEHVLPASWTTALEAVNATITDLDALVIVEASTARLRLEVHHTEWPPPHAPARCSATFEGVEYIQLPTYSTSFARLTARLWANVLATRPRFIDAFPVDGVESDCVLVCFEPDEFGAACGFVIARSMRVE